MESLLCVAVSDKVAPERKERTVADGAVRQGTWGRRNDNPLGAWRARGKALRRVMERQALAVLRTSGMKKTNIFASTMVKAMK